MVPRHAFQNTLPDIASQVQLKRTRHLLLLGRASRDFSASQQVELELSDRVGRHQVSCRTAETKRVKGALHDASTALHALPGSGHGGMSPAVIDLEDVFGTYPLTKAGPLASVRVSFLETALSLASTGSSVLFPFICPQPLIQLTASSRSVEEKLFISPLIISFANFSPHSTHLGPPITPILSKSFLCVRPK